MSFAALLNRRFNVYRRTAILVAEVTLAASHTAAITPTVPYAVEVEISGSPSAFGTVTITGTINGTAGQTQVLTFTGVGKQATSKVFDKNTAIAVTSSGWTGTATTTVRAVNRDGSHIKALSLVVSAWPGRLSRSGRRWETPISGSTQTESPMLFLAYSTVWTPREGDELYDRLTPNERWKVFSVPTIDELAAPHHWELSVQREET